MVGSNGTMIAIRLVRSKLRKREDHSNTVHPEPAVVQTAAPPVPALVAVPGVAPSCVQPAEGCCPADLGPVVEPDLAYSTTTTASAGQFVWQFPPPYPPPNTPPPQYTLYNNDQDNLVHTLQSDRPGFAKGFRKNLGGRWRRLVKRKPEMETCAIPPELKDQLKTIYVY